MKKLLVNFAALLCLLTLAACGSDDDPTPEYTSVPISETYLPVSMTVAGNDASLQKKCNDLDNKVFIVNSAKDLPEDPIGYTQSYFAINYSQSTLLVGYSFHPYNFDTYTSVYQRNNNDKSYRWQINLTTSEPEYSSVGLKSLTRFAIEVPKLSKNANLKTVWNVSWSGQ